MSGKQVMWYMNGRGSVKRWGPSVLFRRIGRNESDFVGRGATRAKAFELGREINLGRTCGPWSIL